MTDQELILQTRYTQREEFEQVIIIRFYDKEGNILDTLIQPKQ